MLDTNLAALVQAAQQWILEDPDPETRAEASDLIARAEDGDTGAQVELADAYGGRLAFGTAGLRGQLGAGPKRMNRLVVIQTSAGFAKFLLERAANSGAMSPPSVVIGYDGRINSDVFARDTAEIMAGAGLGVTLLPSPLPTPVTAFAVRHLGVSAGVMITASHNPPRDNGYKVYLGDADAGAQIAPPIDAEIAACIEQVAAQPLRDHPRSTEYELAEATVLEAYIAQTAESVREEHLAREPNPPGRDLRIAYTAMHGVGSETAQRVFELAGLPQVTPVAEQNDPDGSFPTVSFPNPEEPGALDLAYETANRIDADLIVAHDPDADRLAIALPHPDESSGYRRLTGNELGLILGWRAAQRFRQANPTARGALACTIVSSPALQPVAEAYELEYAETLSGFKWVARVPHLIFGYEEALGYLTNPEIVRDKDGISASADLIALARELAIRGQTLWDLLDDASERFGHFASSQVTMRLDSMAATEALSNRIRTVPPERFGASRVECVTDLAEPGNFTVPANVLRYDLAGGARVMIRPSGTEPKLKVYIDTFSDAGDAAERRARAEHDLASIEAGVRAYLDATGKLMGGS